jgi:hypothetical protein
MFQEKHVPHSEIVCPKNKAADSLRKWCLSIYLTTRHLIPEISSLIFILTAMSNLKSQMVLLILADQD